MQGTLKLPRSRVTKDQKRKDNEGGGTIQFVNAVPLTDDEKSALRSLVRSNATAHRWKQWKAMQERLKAAKEAMEELSPNFDDINSPSKASSSPDLENWFAATGLVSQRGSSLCSEGTAHSSNIREDDHHTFHGYHTGPQTLLDHGEMDPFNSYPSDLPQDMVSDFIKYNVQVILPSLLPSVSGRFENPSVQGWVRHAMSSPALFHCFMHGAAVHSRAVRGLSAHGDSDSTEIVLSHARTIEYLNKHMQDPNNACSDENILAVLGLSSYGTDVSMNSGRKLPSQGPLRSLQALDTYSGLKSVDVHVAGLAKMIGIRGGLENIKMEGLAATISYQDILTATRRLQGPYYPFVALPGSVPEETVPAYNIPSGLGTLGCGFNALWDLSNDHVLTQLLNTLRGISEYILAIHDYCEGRQMRPNMIIMINQRNSIQHRIMQLPMVPNYSIEPLYESCRLAIIVYSLLVILPVSPGTAPFAEIARRLANELSSSLVGTNYRRASGLITWILVMGGIAAVDHPERSHFVKGLQAMLVRMEISTWASLKALLQTFLWFESTSDGDGLALWHEVHGSSKVSEII